MGKEERQKDYLAKAKEAEAQASKCRDEVLRQSLIKIAESYRELAKHQ